MIQNQRCPVIIKKKFHVTLHRYEGFATSEEAQLVGNILNYYDQCDGDTVSQLLKNPLFKYLDNDVSIHQIPQKWLEIFTNRKIHTCLEALFLALEAWLPIYLEH